MAADALWTLDELVQLVADVLDGAAYPGAPNGRVRDVPDRPARARAGLDPEGTGQEGAPAGRPDRSPAGRRRGAARARPPGPRRPHRDPGGRRAAARPPGRPRPAAPRRCRRPRRSEPEMT